MSKQRKLLAIQLRVAEAKQRDVGKARAKLDSQSLNELKIAAGDVIELVGKKSTVAVATTADPGDETLSIVRIDGQTRKNASVALNEFVTVRKIQCREAKSVSLIPLGSKASMDREFAEFVKNRLRGMAAVPGDELSVMVLGNALLFRVQKVRPKACVKIVNSTVLSFLPESVSQKNVQPASYEEIGGLDEEIRRLREIVELPLRRPEVFQKLGVDPPNGILLYGPPGCGKTLIARALANECEANFYTLNGPEIMNKYYGETEAKLRDLFKEARDNSPSIIFIDEIDALAPRREEAFGDVEKRVVGQLLALTDGVADRGDVIVIGATNRPDSIDPALRRPGRFDREVHIGVPNPESRLEILQIHTRGMPIADDVDLEKLASELHGYTGADIRALCREAALKALRRYIPDLDIVGEEFPPEVVEKMQVSASDFRDASREIIPTAMREFYTETPKVKWSEIGGLEEVKRSLIENVVWAIRDPSKFRKVGVSPAKGLFLYGPPGCGKTLLARALATESGGNFILIKGPEILSKWHGESEKAVREIFKKAKASSPCIVLLDELDSIAVTRTGSSQQSDKLLSQLLTEIDSSGPTSDVFIVGATNRPDLVDISLLRPGRLDVMVYVPPPDDSTRLAILEVHTAKMPLSPQVSLEEIASQTRGYSGADLLSLCREAAIEAIRNNPLTPTVTSDDFHRALSIVRPGLTLDIENWFSGAQKRLKGSKESSGFIG
jgi:transitional endoplasmic reticulum ATPase